MSSETDLQRDGARPFRLLAVALLFAVAGPPLAGAVAIVLLSAFAMAGSGVPILEALQVYLSVILPVDPATLYLAPYWGLVPALAAGVFTGWHLLWRGRIGVFSSFLLGLGVGALFYLVGAFVGWAGASYGASFSIAVCAPPVMLLSFLSRFIAAAGRQA